LSRGATWVAVLKATWLGPKQSRLGRLKFCVCQRTRLRELQELLNGSQGHDAPPNLDAVALDRTGHTVRTAAPLPQLEAFDLDHLDAVVAELPIRELVLVVADDHSRLERHEVVATVPLLAGLLGVVSSRRDDV